MVACVLVWRLPMAMSLDDLSNEYLRQTVEGAEFRRQLRFAHARGLLVAALQDAGLSHLCQTLYESGPDQTPTPNRPPTRASNPQRSPPLSRRPSCSES